ncbi:hypothetical protein E2562_038412 [Oryza meyeriana var. granulata]|uniref:Uncharacterized protein n=1 Tax=Oryza meyeriana var. granulata TaxID=110450 RepID=A0A6G1FGL4_9ORYZ|nr:hypothetical protein E2562_038412 [Oryza meyeriana var. granulata]
MISSHEEEARGCPKTVTIVIPAMMGRLRHAHTGHRRVPNFGDPGGVLLSYGPRGGMRFRIAAPDNPKLSRHGG